MAKNKREGRKPYTPPYTNIELLAVWRKGRILKDEKASEWRMDDFDNLIWFAAYGDRDSFFGWEVDHIIPVSDGGVNDLINLRPLQWEANVKRN